MTGTVKDDQGGVIPGATVTLVSEARGTSLEAVTTATGDFVFSNIIGDTYTGQSLDGRLQDVRAQGASPSVRAIAWWSGTLNLEVGALAETVLVSGEAPMIQSQTGERSFTVAQTQVENLPNTGRNFASFAALVPGVVGTTVSAGANAAITRLGGGTTNFLLDGVSNVDPGGNGQGLQLNMDAIAEVRVLSSAYQAEYGRSSGLQISGVTKSGTNQFHGSFFDIERNSNVECQLLVERSRTALRSLCRKSGTTDVRSAAPLGRRAGRTACSSSTPISSRRARREARSTCSACRLCSSVKGISPSRETILARSSRTSETRARV